MVSKKTLRNIAIVVGVGAAGYIIFQLHRQGFFQAQTLASLPVSTPAAPAASIPQASAPSLFTSGFETMGVRDF